MRSRRLTLMLALLLVVPFFAIGDSGQEASWQDGRRETSMQWDTQTFRFESVRVTKDANDRMNVSFALSDGVLTYGFNALKPTPSDVLMAIRFDAMVEFLDRDGDGRYGLGDPQVQRIAFVDMPQSVLRVEAVSEDAWEAVAYYHFPGANFFRDGITLRFALRGDPTPFMDVPMAATTLPWNVTVTGFPFQSAENGTRLALLVRVDADLDFGNRQAALQAGPYQHALTWAGDITGTDGTILGPVVTTQQHYRPVNQSVESVLAWAYPQEALVHRMAIQSTWSPDSDVIEVVRDALGDWRFYLGSLLVAAAIIGATLYRNMERKEERS